MQKVWANYPMSTNTNNYLQALFYSNQGLPSIMHV